MNSIKSSQKIKDKKVVTNSKSKKIGYFTTLLIVMGSSIGSGIFFKSGGIMSNVDNSIILSLLSWLIAAFAVMAMAIALIDVAAQSKKDDRGLLSWIKRFNGMYIYKSVKNLFAFFILPIKYFLLPVYFFQSLQTGLMYADAQWVVDTAGVGHIVLGTFGENVANFPWWGVFIVVLGIDVYFLIVNSISIRVGTVTAKLLMYVKFVPLLFAFIIGFIILGMNGGLPSSNDWWINGALLNPPIDQSTSPKTLTSISPAIGVIMSLSSVFFAFDGFYVAAGIQSELKEPKKISNILLFGLLFVTIIYLSIALSMTFGAIGGKWANVGEFFVSRKISWIFSIISVLISIGIIGILNGYTMWTIRLYQELINSREVPFAKKLMYLNTKNGKPLGGILYAFVFVLVLLIAFILIAALAYHIQNKPLISNIVTYDPNTNKLVTGGYITTQVNGMYGFADMISNWQTIFTFAFISIAILSSTLEKNKQYVKTRKEYIQITAGWIAIVIIGVALLFQIAQPFANLSFAIEFNENANLHNSAKTEIFPHISLVAILFVALIITFIPSIFEVRNQMARQIFNLEDKIWRMQYKKDDLIKELEYMQK